MTTPDRIDFADVAERADLRRIIEADCGPPNRSRKYHCPFHDDENPSLGITPDGKHWKCWSCEATGDALDWISRQDNVDVVEAAKRLDPSHGKPSGERQARPATRPNPRPATAPGWHEPTWQAAVNALVVQAERTLWGPDGRVALDWLRGRGLDDATIGRFRLGFTHSAGWTSPVSRPDGTIGGHAFERGITIPWCAPGAWYGKTDSPDVPRWCGLNIRRLNTDVSEPWVGPDKCKLIRGSERGHLYPWPDLLPTQPTIPALLVEGEFDALVGVQEAGWLAHVGTVGGANQGPHRSALAALAVCPWWLVATDRDGAGIEAVWSWRQRSPRKARRLLLPSGKDLAEFHQSGGDVPGWLESEITRVGIR